MTLITWNCQGAFRNKYPSIFAHHPDILIIQESEHTNKLTYTANTPTQSLWYGDNPHKGISIYTFGSYSIKPHKSHNPDFKYIIPLTITREGQTFILLAIWANNAQDPGSYIEQVWKAIHYYEKLLKQPIILTGDFNSNTIWDKPRRVENNKELVND